jgi:hypothetical protein
MFSSLPFPILAVSVSKLAKTILQWSPSSTMGFTIQLAVGKDSYGIAKKNFMVFFPVYVFMNYTGYNTETGQGILALNSEERFFPMPSVVRKKPLKCTGDNKIIFTLHIKEFKICRASRDSVTSFLTSAFLMAHLPPGP